MTNGSEKSNYYFGYLRFYNLLLNLVFIRKMFCCLLYLGLNL